MNLTLLKDRRVLVTGHTGFKGSWLTLWLHHLGATVYGYSLPTPTAPANYTLSRVAELLCGETIADVRQRDTLRQVVKSFKPEVIFHLAAQPLVRASYLNPYETFDVNVMGSAALLEAVRAADAPCAIICVTSDKCYENSEQLWGYRECDPMGGHDPYSASKGAAELLIAAWRRSFFDPARLASHGVQLASVRAGNVIGGGDWATDRIVTDIVAGLIARKPVTLRNPHAVRPWQHVLEPLVGYLTLAATMLSRPDTKWSSSWNFGPLPGDELSVGELAQAMTAVWGGGTCRVSTGADQPHEAGLLRLSIDKVLSELPWRPRWSSATMIERTAAWYRQVLLEHTDARTACLSDIAAYSAALPLYRERA